MTYSATKTPKAKKTVRSNPAKSNKKSSQSQDYYCLKTEGSGFAVWKISDGSETKVSDYDIFPIAMKTMERLIRKDLGL